MIWNLSLSSMSAVMLGLSSVMLFFGGLKMIWLSESYLLEWCFFSFNSVSMKGVLLFDWMSLVFMSIVLLISASIMVYLGSYMSEDLTKARFYYLVLLFVGSMLLMIMSPNFISILLGWDGLGLVSYCLVIYYQNSKSYNAGMITILSNRVHSKKNGVP